ncbi:hypothetical protein [Streptomyces sp. CB01881]|uniref:hypothetical protein n=1 Tax=Streptomyces sp. CB01881 TaxID=2078691 RepID=UPI000CDBBEEA|nr:hypothetical protein [Streptomyces sp. CB01881]AUY51805.1 hypothetical protein C2142_26055 [Streptomyces sp. CB01881]TYC71234.1 hypothetical protein EH183_26040 [Streptomyces sp. CB01881]
MDMLGVMVGLALLFGLAMVTLAVVGTVKAAKTVARKVERHEANARRAVENVTLKAKTYTKPGPQGQISAVRLGLRTSLEGTRQVLESGLAQDGQLGESLALLRRLDAHAAELDGELRILEREPDAGRIAAKLPELRERAGRITHSAETMRWAAQDRMHRFADDELSRLSQECESEAGALRHWDTSGGAGAGGGVAGGTAAGGASGPAGEAPGAGREQAQRAGLTDGRGGRPGAEELLGLADPLARLAERLRKPSAGPSAG